jgi:hypothetical protein
LLLLRIIRRLKDIIFSADYELAELYSAGLALWSCLVLCQDPHYLAAQPRLVVLLHYAPQPIWALRFALVGTLQLALLILGGLPAMLARDEGQGVIWHLLRIIGLLLGVFLWRAMSVLVSEQGPSLGTGSFGMTAVGCALGCWRLSTLVRVDLEVIALKKIRAQQGVAPEPLGPAKKFQSSTR